VLAHGLCLILKIGLNVLRLVVFFLGGSVCRLECHKDQYLVLFCFISTLMTSVWIWGFAVDVIISSPMIVKYTSHFVLVMSKLEWDRLMRIYLRSSGRLRLCLNAAKTQVLLCGTLQKTSIVRRMMTEMSLCLTLDTAGLAVLDVVRNLGVLSIWRIAVW
jgi:hypothetical protein